MFHLGGGGSVGEGEEEIKYVLIFNLHCHNPL